MLNFYAFWTLEQGDSRATVIINYGPGGWGPLNAGGPLYTAQPAQPIAMQLELSTPFDFVWQFSTDFQNSFTGTLCGKLVMKLILKIPLHSQRVLFGVLDDQLPKILSEVKGCTFFLDTVLIETTPASICCEF